MAYNVQFKFREGSALYNTLDLLKTTGQVDYKELTKVTGKDIATFNNPKSREVLEKELAAFVDIAAGGNSGPERVGRAGASGDFRFAETVARDTALAAGPRNSGDGFFTFFISLAFFVVFVVFAFFGAVGAAAINCSLCKCSVAFLRDAAETTSLRDARAPAGAVVALTALWDDRGTLAE